MEQAVFDRLAHRPKDSYKYSFGHVLIVGGSNGMVGAPFLAAQAALRSGAGLVTIASDRSVIEKLERRVLEIMTLSVAMDTASSFAIIQQYVKSRKVSVLVIGPGLRPSAAPLVLSILKAMRLPAVIDSGALGILAAHQASRNNFRAAPLILTPHHGELRGFLKQPLSQKQADVLSQAEKLAQQQNYILVLKGAPTYTILPDGTQAKNTTGGPGLATAGTGDVLAGMIGAFIAQGIAAEQAVPAAVYLHGKAGDIATGLKTEAGVIASDVIEAIPTALKQII